MTTIATGPASVFPRLEPLLARVSKPIQYVGGELNSVTKDWGSVEVRWCLSYPDAYEVGLPNQGVAILYEILNERGDAADPVWESADQQPRDDDARGEHGEDVGGARHTFGREPVLLEVLDEEGDHEAFRGPCGQGGSAGPMDARERADAASPSRSTPARPSP